MFATSVFVFFFLAFNITFIQAGHKHFGRWKPYLARYMSGKCRFDEGNLNQSDFTPGELCKRPCDGTPKKCHFTFFVEEYTTMGAACGRCPDVLADCSKDACIAANGYPRTFVGVNRQMPGPSIEICQHDTLIVDVMNLMHAETTTIHWHGIRQNGTYQYFDGVPYITQCPIMPGNKFRYTFPVPDCGTFWYHSHSGMQRADGFIGSLIVRCIHEPLKDMYDKDDTTIICNDWTKTAAGTLISGFNLDKHDLHPEDVLINGRSHYYNKRARKHMPLKVIDVTQGLKYRVRLIAATSYTCAYYFQIQNHTMTAISVDGGHRIKPKTVDTIVLNSGERYDFVLHANQPCGLYFIWVKGAGICRAVSSYTILRYNPCELEINWARIDRKFKSNPPMTRNVTLNAIDSTCSETRSDEEKEKDICIVDLEGEGHPIDVYDPQQCPSNSTFIFDISIMGVSRDDINRFLYEKFVMPGMSALYLVYINDIVFSSPSTTLLGIHEGNTPTTFCNQSCYDRSVQKAIPCECTAVYQIALGDCVTLIVRIGEYSVNHPMHIHGYNPQVVFQEGGPQFADMTDEELMELAFSDHTKLTNRPMKDVISMPAPGLVILRFIADNPGYWYFHCHWAFHGELGMTVVLQVGTPEEHPAMPIGFPSCRDFVTMCL